MLGLLIFIFFPVLIIGIRNSLSFRIRFSKGIVTTLIWASLTLTLFFIIGTVLSNFNVYWRGYRSHTFILIALGICSILFYLCHPIGMFSKAISINVTVMIFLFAGISLFLVIEVADDYHEQLFYTDRKHRIEQTNRGLMSPASLPKLFVKNGLFEKAYDLQNRDDSLNGDANRAFTHKDKIFRIELEEPSNDSVIVKFFHTVDTAVIRQNPLIFRRRIN